MIERKEGIKTIQLLHNVMRQAGVGPLSCRGRDVSMQGVGV